MKLLDAVNLVLPKLGERPVTSLTVKHPTLAVLLPIIEQKLRSVLTRGWWFNEYAYTAPLAVDGTITLGTDTLAFRPDYPDTAVARGLKLFNPKNFDYTFDAAVPGTVTQYVQFDELPEAAAEHILYAALVEAFTTDLGVTSELQVWQTLAGSAWSDLLTEHLQQKRYSTRRTRAWRSYKRALRS